MREMVLVLDNLRSAHNVGALLRTAEGLGLKTVFTCGLTPHPRQPADNRLPHVVARAERAIAKTALGAQKNLEVIHYQEPERLAAELKAGGHSIIVLENAPGASELPDYRPPAIRLALVLGHERQGVGPVWLAAADSTLLIPMAGRKRSFNVAAAGAMALFHFRFKA